MGNRLSRIYTRTGDDGTTGFGDGSRVRKDHARVEAYGTVDEANSAIGMILSVPGLPAEVSRCLTEIQHDLFDLGGELCIPGTQAVKAEHIAQLEQVLDKFNDPLPALKDFILPGGGPAAAACHLARTIVRRAERRVWTLAEAEQVNVEVPKYLNRLSDLLFVVARVLARHEHGRKCCGVMIAVREADSSSRRSSPPVTIHLRGRRYAVAHKGCQHLRGEPRYRTPRHERSRLADRPDSPCAGWRPGSAAHRIRRDLPWNCVGWRERGCAGAVAIPCSIRPPWCTKLFCVSPMRAGCISATGNIFCATQVM